MKFIGPFLRINSLDKEDIVNQLFHLSKQSLRHIVLDSKCGIPISPHELSKHTTNIDLNSIKTYSPLLCIYKKGSAKLTTENNRLLWNTEKFKKDILISSNAFMTLSLIELCKYYDNFENIDNDKYLLKELYTTLSKLQLEFYASNLRNIEGVFIDKEHTSELFSSKIELSDKNIKFKFSDQALLMCAYYNISTIYESNNDNSIEHDNLPENKKKDSNKHEIKPMISKEEFKKFSLDILNMFIDFREDLYEISFMEKLKTSIYLNIFYRYSKEETCKPLLFDLFDIIYEESEDHSSSSKKNTVIRDSLISINSMLMYSNFKFLKAKELSDSVHSQLSSIYDESLGLFQKDLDSKTVDYTCDEVLTYLYEQCMYSTIFDTDDNYDIIENIFKKGVVNSGLILSWPDVPNLNDCERYRGFSKKSEDLLDDEKFRLPTISTPTSNELAPIFIKKVSLNRKKTEFKQSKFTFDSNKNMSIFFMFIFFYNNFI